MAGKTLALLRWQLVRGLHIEWPVWAASALVMISSFFAYMGLELERENRSLLETEDIVLPTPRRLDRPAAGNGLEAYYAALPNEEERFILLKRVLLSAREKGVFPPQADYKLESEAMTKTTRYRLSLALQGRFSDIQAFLVDVLNENRSIAVDSISVKRESLEKPDVEARVQFSILMARS
jgi:hypothetical protein